MFTISGTHYPDDTSYEKRGICFQKLRITTKCWRNYDVIESAIFVISEVKKADNIPDDNFDKFKRIIIIHGRLYGSTVQWCIYGRLLQSYRVFAGCVETFQRKFGVLVT